MIRLENASNTMQHRSKVNHVKVNHVKVNHVKVNHVKSSYLNMHLAVLDEVLSFMNKTKKIYNLNIFSQ